MLLSLVEKFIESKGGKELGFSLLQRRSGVSTSSLRRLLQGDQNPSFANAVKILAIVAADKRQSRDVLQSMYPEIMSKIDTIFSEQALDNAVDGEHLNDLYRHLVRQPHCQIIHLCANSFGTTRLEVQKSFGKPGLDALDDLNDDSLLVERDGRLCLIAPNFNIVDPDVLKRTSVALADSFDIRNLGTHRAVMGQASEAVNDEGLKLISEAIRDCLKKIGEVRDSDRYKGSNIFYSVLMTNVLNTVGESTSEE